MNEKTLIQGLKERKQSAFRSLVMDYQDQVVNICYGFLKNREDAEDVAQEVFIAVYKSIGNFRSDARLSTWLYRIAVNRSLNLVKKNKRKQWIGSFQTFFGGESETLQVPDSHHVGAQESLERAERLATLHQVISSLPNNQKIAFSLQKYEDLSYKEIAEVMEISLSAVESLIHRAKKNLQKKLHDFYHKK